MSRGSVCELSDLKINQRSAENLTKLLDLIKQDVPEVQLISIVNAGGHLITSTQPELKETGFVLGAMTAAIINIAQQASLKLDKGDPSDIIIECPKGLIVLKYVNEQILVAAVTTEGAQSDKLISALNKAQPDLLKFDQIV